MRLGTSAIKGWCEPCENIRNRKEVPWQPCEWELLAVLQTATNQHCHTEGTSVEKLAWADTYHKPLPVKGGKGQALNQKNRQPKQWSTKLNWASQMQIYWPKQWSIQGSNPQRSAEQKTVIKGIRVHTYNVQLNIRGSIMKVCDM